LNIVRLVLQSAVLASVALFVTAYTASAYYAASYVHEWEGRLMWPSMPGGSFYPWPHGPTGFQFYVLTPLNDSDSWYYANVIQSGILLYLTLLLWALAAWRAWRIMKYTRRSRREPPMKLE
jgi:hypothetical protein